MGLVGGLAVVAGGVGLPGLVEGLEEEGVDAPVESATAVKEGLVTVVAGLSVSIQEQQLTQPRGSTSPRS